MLVIDELDAVARSRQAEGDMHSDEKASVNELLVQLDRVGCLGRLVVGTTNYVSSLDDAVVRSGRFGRFIPVPPPSLDEAAQILDYYLRGVSADATGGQPRVQVLPAKAVHGILKTVYEKNVQEHRFFCGADLEEAVNRAYLRRLRETVDRQPAGADLAVVTVEITGKDLWDTLQEVPRSVTREAVARFLQDVDRFCGSSLAKQLSESLFEGKSG
jgi:SpoVK/Ycf46/Vps4 family AAA+-type ATPase